MEPFDFSGITTEQLSTAYNRAIDKSDFANAMMFKAELDRRSPKAMPDTNVVEQGLGGAYSGLAAGLGAPVDIAASGLRMAGVPVGDAPVGGAESIKGLLGAISGGTAIPETPPQTLLQRLVRGAAEAVGEAAPAAAALPMVGGRAVVGMADDAWNAFKSLLSEGSQAAKAAPATYAATEAGVSAASGLGGASLAEMFPENPTAEMIGQLLGATAGAGGVRAAERILTPMPKGPLSADDMKRAASELYTDQVEQGLSAQPTITKPMVDSMFQRLDEQGIILPNGRVDPDYPKVSGVFSVLSQYADKGMTGANILRTRQALSNRLKDATGSEKNMVRNMLRQFDEYTGEIAPTIKAANALYARAMKAEQLDDMMELADIDAGKFSQSGIENAIRTQFRALARRIVKGHEMGWSPDEVQQIKQIAAGGTLENAARFIGKFSPKGVISAGVSLGVPFSAAMKVTNDPYVSGAAAGMVGLTGKAGELTAAALQKSNVDRLMSSVLQGRNLAKPAEDRLRAAVTAYLAGQAANTAAATEQ